MSQLSTFLHQWGACVYLAGMLVSLGIPFLYMSITSDDNEYAYSDKSTPILFDRDVLLLLILTMMSWVGVLVQIVAILLNRQYQRKNNGK